MEQQNELILSPGIADVVKQFEQWRQTRKSRCEPIPEQLWQAAVQLAGRYSINKISKALRMNYTDSKNHFYGRPRRQAIKSVQPAGFIELDCKNPFLGSECIIEMKNKDGSTMKWHVKGSMQLDLIKLSKAFWSNG